MGFVGMFLIAVIMVILIIIVIVAFLIAVMLAFGIVAIILKTVGKKDKSLRVVGNVFLVISFVIAILVTIIVGYFIHNWLYVEVALPDGNSAYVSERAIDRMNELVRIGDRGMGELDKLLDKDPDLVHYLDWEEKTLLDHGLEKGDFDLVKAAVEHGAKFDNLNSYEDTLYVSNSMAFYLESIFDREVSNEDVAILKLMFKCDVSMDFEDLYEPMYSNLFGKAVCSVLYNDDYVTDIELEFIQVFMDNGYTEDPMLSLYEEEPDTIAFSFDYNIYVVKDENYYNLMELIGREN